MSANTELVSALLAEANRQANETADLLNRAAEAIAQNTRRDGEPVVSAEDRFEQYVATLIAKNPDVRELGERLALWLDDDQFNNIEPVLLGIAKSFHADRARVPDAWVMVPREPTEVMRDAGMDAHFHAEKRASGEANLGHKGMFSRKNRAAHVYAAMLDAAPSHPDTTGATP